MPTQLRRQRLKQFTAERRLADKVLEILIWSGMFHQGHSISGGGPNFYFPRVEEVINVKGQPARLKIRMRPGQMITEFLERKKMLEHHLQVHEVIVTPLGPPDLILMELRPKKNFPLRFWELV